MNEKIARIFVAILLLGGGIAIGLAWRAAQTNSVTLRASMPENGGWSPIDLSVAAGQPLNLRLTSDDVMHGFAIGQSDQPAVDIKPGEMTELTLTFERPGAYTFYCTRWCGPNHWRMRGTITVTGESVAETTVTQPLFVQLDLDIDAERQAQILPAERPLAERGAQFPLPDAQLYLSQAYYRAHSPEEVWRDLRADPQMDARSDMQLWDTVAFIWQSNAAPQALAEAKQRYAQNCAACHGQSGAGDGVFSETQAAAMSAADDSISGHEIVPATDFTDPVHMLSASPALLQGKLIRGGMGTGMPMWGVIFTEEQTWSLVSYLYTFQFEEIVNE